MVFVLLSLFLVSNASAKPLTADQMVAIEKAQKFKEFSVNVYKKKLKYKTIGESTRLVLVGIESDHLEGEPLEALKALIPGFEIIGIHGSDFPKELVTRFQSSGSKDSRVTICDRGYRKGYEPSYIKAGCAILLTLATSSMGSYLLWDHGSLLDINLGFEEVDNLHLEPQVFFPSLVLSSLASGFGFFSARADNYWSNQDLFNESAETLRLTIKNNGARNILVFVGKSSFQKFDRFLTEYMEKQKSRLEIEAPSSSSVQVLRPTVVTFLDSSDSLIKLPSTPDEFSDESTEASEFSPKSPSGASEFVESTSLINGKEYSGRDGEKGNLD